MSVIRFEQVSKRYELGIPRMSLPSFVSSWVRERVSGPRRETTDNVLWALKDVSFELERGESLALLGPNGAGKTTVLKLLASITQPSSGRVSVSGRMSALIELGAGFHGDLTGRDNIFLNGAIIGLSRQEVRNRFDEIVDFSGLERFIDTPVKRYSSGMIVRLGFAVASCIEPDILLADEVLAVGDATFSQKCLARLQSLLKRGTTLVFVSHNLFLVKSACKRSLYMRSGQVQLAGETDAVIAAYEQDLLLDRAAASPRGEESQSRGADVHISEVDFSGEGVTGTQSALRADRGAEIRMHYTSSRDIDVAHAAVFIRRNDGLLCSVSRTHFSGTNVSLSRGGGVIVLRLERLQLTGGVYCAEAYLLDRSDAVVLTPGGGQSAWVTVVGEAFSSTDERGVFEPVVEWSQPTAVDAASWSAPVEIA